MGCGSSRASHAAPERVDASHGAVETVQRKRNAMMAHGNIQNIADDFDDVLDHYVEVIRNKKQVAQNWGDLSKDPDFVTKEKQSFKDTLTRLQEFTKQEIEIDADLIKACKQHNVELSHLIRDLKAFDQLKKNHGDAIKKEEKAHSALEKAKSAHEKAKAAPDYESKKSKLEADVKQAEQEKESASKAKEGAGTAVENELEKMEQKKNNHVKMALFVYMTAHLRHAQRMVQQFTAGLEMVTNLPGVQETEMGMFMENFSPPVDDPATKAERDERRHERQAEHHGGAGAPPAASSAGEAKRAEEREERSEPAVSRTESSVERREDAGAGIGEMERKESAPPMQNEPERR